MVYLVTNQKNLFNDMGTEVQFASSDELKNYFKNHKEIDFDTETEGFDPYTCKVLSAQFGDSENQYVVDCSTVPLTTFKDLLESPDICWNMQNAKFDLKFLYHQRIVPVKVYDTFLAEKVLTLGILNARRALDHLVWKYCKQTMDKSVRGNIHREGLSKRVILYGAKDVAFLGEIKRKQLAKIKEAELEKALQLENLFVKVLAYIEYSGFYLNQDAWRSKMESDLTKLNAAREALDNWVIENNLVKFIDTQLDLFFTGKKCTISWSSPKQVIPLFKQLGIDTKVKDKKTGGFKDSAEASVLKGQKDKSSIVEIYLKYKALEKVVSTYGESFLRSVNKVSGRIHTQFNQLMNTGRLSCGGKNFATKEEYINFQNIPATPEKREPGAIYERDCFIPQKGRHFIVSDFSGQEAVVLVNQSLDKDLLVFYDQKLGDMHSYNTSMIFSEVRGKDLKLIKKENSDLRQKSKAVTFAIQFGGNGSTIARNLGIEESEGNRIYNSYMSAFPGLASYWESNKRDTLRTGYVEFNHVTKRKSYIDFFQEFKELEAKIKVPNFWDRYRTHKQMDSNEFQQELLPLVRKYFNYKGDIERRAMNYRVQGTAADITKLAAIYIFNHLHENNLLFKVWFPNIVHDEVVLECPESLSKDLTGVITNCMEKAGSRFYNRVPFTASTHSGLTWEH